MRSANCRVISGRTAGNRRIDIGRRVHLCAKCLDFGQGKVCRAALGSDTRGPGSGTFGIECWTSHDIGRGVQVALCVTTDQFQVLGKRHITFDDARSQE
jgi:hypothetical protein